MVNLGRKCRLNMSATFTNTTKCTRPISWRKIYLNSGYTKQGPIGYINWLGKKRVYTDEHNLIPKIMNWVTSSDTRSVGPISILDWFAVLPISNMSDVVGNYQLIFVAAVNQKGFQHIFLVVNPYDMANYIPVIACCLAIHRLPCCRTMLLCLWFGC